MGLIGRFIDSIGINYKAVEQYNNKIELELKSTVAIFCAPANITEIVSKMRDYNVKHGKKQKYVDIGKSAFNLAIKNSYGIEYDKVVKLELMLSLSMFYYEVINDIEKAVNVSEEAILKGKNALIGKDEEKNILRCLESIKGIADEIEFKMGEAGVECKHSEGYDSASWILLDFVDVVAHVFLQEEREFYNLERLWKDSAGKIEANVED